MGGVDGVDADGVQVLQEVPSGPGGQHDAAAFGVGEAAIAKELPDRSAELVASGGGFRLDLFPRGLVLQVAVQRVRLPRWDDARAASQGSYHQACTLLRTSV